VRVPNYDEFGPWYASAYGLVAGFHYRATQAKNGEIRYNDNGIRSHGSVDYNSILRRYSHGCHRLYNHMAIRLFSFVLKHKKYNRVGEVPVGYARKIVVDEEEFVIRLASRGYKYELVNPVPVMVETGNIRGSQKTPLEIYMPKPGEQYGSDAQFLPPQYKHLAGESTTDTDSAPAAATDTDTAPTVPSRTPAAGTATAN
jgi:hypothetical protein